MKIIVLALVAVIEIAAAGGAKAAPVTWTVDVSLNNSFSPGDPVTDAEQLTGHFTYDYAAAAFTDIGLVINGSSGAFAYHFAIPRSGPFIVDFFESDPNVADLNDESSLAIGFNLSTGLLNFSNALGSFPLTNFVTDPLYVAQSSRQQCLSADCTVTSSIMTVAQAGTLKGTAVPLPATILLLCPAIGILHRARRQQAICIRRCRRTPHKPATPLASSMMPAGNGTGLATSGYTVPDSADKLKFAIRGPEPVGHGDATQNRGVLERGIRVELKEVGRVEPVITSASGDGVVHTELERDAKSKQHGVGTIDEQRIGASRIH